MPFRTALTDALGIAIPVVQGGMQWVGYAELASAVSNAGGLGIVCSLPLDTSQFHHPTTFWISLLTFSGDSSPLSPNPPPKIFAKKSAVAGP